MAKGGFAYIMTNKHHTTLYVGVTSDLISRVIEHKTKFYPKSFTARYNINKLIYFRPFDMIESAIEEEKRIKGGSREKKVNLIESINPSWRDLYEDIKNW